MEKVVATDEPRNSQSDTTTQAQVATSAKPQAKASKVETDLSSVQVGINVAHKKFGQGKITHIGKAQKYIQVEFGSGTKTFVIPMYFEQKFLEII